MIGGKRTFKIIILRPKSFLLVALMLSFYFNMTYGKLTLLSILRHDTMLL